jgi:hypothetical protein
MMRQLTYKAQLIVPEAAAKTLHTGASRSLVPVLLLITLNLCTWKLFHDVY